MDNAEVLVAEDDEVQFEVYEAVAEDSEEIDLDIYVANNAPAANELLLNSGSGQFTRASSAQTKDLYEDDENTNYVTAADFDGDGSIEYVFLFSFREGCSCFFLFLSTSY